MEELTRTTLIEKLITRAKLEVGVKEQGGNNKGAKIVEYQKATWLTPSAWPWCAAFTCYLLKEWLGNSLVTKTLGVVPETWRCKDASAFGWIKWAKDRKLYITDEKELAKAGDFIIFDFSHIGLVIEDQKKLTDKIKTIEGNTAPKTEQRDGSNDGVWEMLRSPKLVKAYIRIIK